MAKRSGQRAVKQGGAILEKQARASIDDEAAARPARTNGVQHDLHEAQADATAELSRMIAELNEVRMRLDAIVRKLAQSAVELPTSAETVDDVERLRMRLVAKLDRIRDQLVTRLGEERASRDR